MDGTFPSPTVKEKHWLQNRLKPGVKVLGRKGGFVVWGGERAVFNAWSEAASLISTLSEGQEV